MNTKALFVSNDPNVFNPGSDVRARMHLYAAAIGSLHIVSPANKGAAEEQEGNLFLHPVRAGKLFRVRALASRAHALILSEGIEVVSAQDPFEHGLAALRAVRGTSAKLHVQVHTDFLSPWFTKTDGRHLFSLHASSLNRYRQKLADRVVPAAQGIRVVSERVKGSLVARYGNRISEPSVIPVMVDAIVPAPVPLPAHPFTFALIAVGRLEKEKRMGDILIALKLILPMYPMVGLFIVGDGRERERLERMTHSLGLENKVIFLGNRSDARGLMASAQAFIQASAYEGYGRTLIEAALARIPIITTDVGIVGEVFKGLNDLLVAPVADPTALSRHIIGLLEDNAVRQELTIHAAETVHAYLDAEGDLPARIAADLERTIRRV